MHLEVPVRVWRKRRISSRSYDYVYDGVHHVIGFKHTKARGVFQVGCTVWLAHGRGRAWFYGCMERARGTRHVHQRVRCHDHFGVAPLMCPSSDWCGAPGRARGRPSSHCRRRSRAWGSRLARRCRATIQARMGARGGGGGGGRAEKVAVRAEKGAGRAEAGAGSGGGHGQCVWQWRWRVLLVQSQRGCVGRGREQRRVQMLWGWRGCVWGVRVHGACVCRRRRGTEGARDVPAPRSWSAIWRCELS